jgi:23S rRNA maturation mini-RNase III
MFTLDTTIDAVQTAKKTFVNTVFANHDAVAKALNGFVDAQTEYTKSAVKAGTNAATQLTSEAVKAAQDVAKYDYAKAFEQFTKTFTAKK